MRQIRCMSNLLGWQFMLAAYIGGLRCHCQLCLLGGHCSAGSSALAGWH
ncbi:MAG TPA: hypothetical protein VH164_17955 [Ktedonobacteraceae bacterium]|nr:hypothetical protein [Ktedonobacteraceae bacterium]